jgi:heat shock protein HslJ/uncharacterized membrane protein
VSQVLALVMALRVLDVQVNIQKWQEGVDFYAVGHDPPWSLDLGLDRSLRFEVQDGPSIVAPAGRGHRAADADVVRYRAVTKSGTLTVELLAGDCPAPTTGVVLTHRVRVGLEGPGIDEERRYEGCGRHVVDPRLHDIWALRAIHGEEVDRGAQPRGAPTLELQIGDGRALGHGGCNDFSASFSVERNRIVFGPSGMTRKTCPTGMDLEARFSEALFGRPHTFELGDLGLVLTDRQGRTLVFAKVD